MNDKQLIPSRQIAIPVSIGISLTGALVIAGLFNFLLPNFMRSASLLAGMIMALLGVSLTGFSWVSLVEEGRSYKQLVPILAIRLSISIAFTTWIFAWLLAGSWLSPIWANVTLMAGSGLLLLGFIATLFLRKQVEFVSEEETSKSGLLDEIKSIGFRIGFEDVKYISPCEDPTARTQEYKLLALIREVESSGSFESWKIKNPEKVSEIFALIKLRNLYRS